MATFLYLAQFNFSGVQSFLQRVAGRPWVAFIELLVIGCAVYAVLKFLQGTRGARLVQVLLTILAVSYAVVWVIGHFGFERINVLYPYFLMGVFLVSLVAFQTELRRMLLRVGQGGWLQRFFRGRQEIIDPIVTAVERLSKNKVGALIAIERTTQLVGARESGVPLDAVVSSELLETIFWPGSALHDLGVIVREDRIVAAGCQFPLDESEQVDRSLGSRHRAALGMSNEVDAVVVIVSEETGAISVAIMGRLQRALTVDALRELLIDEVVGHAEEAETQESQASTAIPEVTKDGTGQAA